MTVSEGLTLQLQTDLNWLRRKTQEVTPADNPLGVAATLLLALAALRKRQGALEALGLAANQLGFPLRMFVMTLSHDPPICLINPVITKIKGTQDGNERCLSLPGVECEVKRPLNIKVKALNQYMNPVKHEFNGVHARIACHEIDHLDGILIIDRAESEK